VASFYQCHARESGRPVVAGTGFLPKHWRLLGRPLSRTTTARFIGNIDDLAPRVYSAAHDNVRASNSVSPPPWREAGARVIIDVPPDLGPRRLLPHILRGAPCPGLRKGFGHG
jgi:hypothetical protein